LIDVRERLVSTGAQVVALRQTDTYFAVPRGRLKLREIAGPGAGERAAELIGYRRPDLAGARWSAYDRVPIAPDDAPALKDALTATIGPRAVVVKRREVGLLGRTRVHLDQVDGLGCFVELETVVAPDGDDADAERELAEIVTRLALDRFPVIAGSYADLVQAP
jgi:predicted adenylyl cyclase CyaB